MPSKRSPNCPAHTLVDAIEKAAAIYQHLGRNSFSGAEAVRYMGYNGLNGASRRALGAVRSFGLVEGRGSELRISDDAVLIIADTGADDQQDRQEALARSLCNNPVFAVLNDQFGDHGSLHEISAYLQKNYHFKPAAADKTAQVYQNSLAMIDIGFPSLVVADARQPVSPLLKLSSSDSVLNFNSSTPITTIADSDGPVIVHTGSATTAENAMPMDVETGPAARDEGRSQLETKKDSFFLGENEAMLCWPATMSLAQFEDFTDWLVLEHRKISRDVTGASELVIRRKNEPQGSA